MTQTAHPDTHAERSAETRSRILDAALSEFAANGLAGARTEQIAQAAGVNKALLYYYFESKEKLYSAALEMVSARVRDRSMAVFLREASPGERMLRAALDHFDRILTQREFQTLMQHEMMRLHKGEDGELLILVKRIFAPLHAMFQSMVREGIASGELIEADWLQMVLTALGGNVFYFLSAPIWRHILPFEPFDKEALQARRVALVEFLGKAIFQDREHGGELATKVLNDTPMPEYEEFKSLEVIAEVNARNRVFLILGLLTIGSLIWYFATTNRSGDLQLVGTVDANEVIVSSKIPGRIQNLTVQEGDSVKAGQLIANIESDDLAAALKAAQATAASEKSKLSGTVETAEQNRGETSSATVSAEAQVKAAQAALAQAQANFEHQQADTSRTVALEKQGIMSTQSRDEAVTSLQAAQAAVNAARDNLAAAQANLRQARAHELLTAVSERTVDETRAEEENARALAQEASVEESYAQVVSPIDGKVDVWAARQGEVVTVGAPIVTIMDLSQTWVYAPLPETQADSVELGDSLRVVMPSGDTFYGKVIAKAAEGDFATQRDVNSMKRDIRTIQLKLLIPNPGEKFVPGMTAYVYIPKAKLVKK